MKDNNPGYYGGRIIPSHICNHTHKSLRGCTRLRNHEGPHYNVRSKSSLQWQDSDGAYISNQEEWSALIDKLGQNA